MRRRWYGRTHIAPPHHSILPHPAPHAEPAGAGHPLWLPLAERRRQGGHEAPHRRRGCQRSDGPAPADSLFCLSPCVRYCRSRFPLARRRGASDTMDLEELLIRNKEATYMLKVTGDSMIEAGLLPGDLVLVERRADAKDGDIVIAQIDQGWTMKYFRKRGRKIWLEPANKKYKPIYPAQELKIAAVVIAAIRKY